MVDLVDRSRSSKVRGKPIIMGSATTLIEVARVPELSLLTQSTTAVRLAANPNSDLHTFRMGNGDKLDWVGTRLPEGQSKNAAYVLFDRGQYFECFSVTDCYELIPATEDKVGEEEIDVISKRLKILKAKEAAAAQRVATNISASDLADETEALDVSKKRRRRNSEESLTAMPVNDLKVRKQVARKKKAKDLDGQAQAQSSTALGDVRKAEVDWDYEEGVASDDEEGAALSSDEVEDKREEDVEDSEDEDKVLTNYGESLSKMLQNQKRAQADQELQAYSDDDEDEDEDGNGQGANSNTPKSKNAGQMLARSQVPGTSQVQTEERVREDLLNLLTSKENVTIKMILVELGVSARNQKFQLIKNLITELCDIVTATVDGEQVRYIKIKNGIKPENSS